MIDVRILSELMNLAEKWIKTCGEFITEGKFQEITVMVVYEYLGINPGTKLDVREAQVSLKNRIMKEYKLKGTYTYVYRFPNKKEELQAIKIHE